MSHNTTLIVIPTYNERENVQALYQAIKQLPCNVDILFCDDNSPDGTGKIIDQLAAKDTSVHVIHRPAKLGTGTAFIAAFDFANDHHYHYVITMDADFTHDPQYIPQMLAIRDIADIIIGSRYVNGGTMIGWNALRLPFTYFWRSMIKCGLGMPYDCTGAFRLYHISVLNPTIYRTFTSRGFSFCMESLYRFVQAGAHVAEIPIVARSRTAGKSKLSSAIMKEVFTKYCALVADRIKHNNHRFTNMH